MNDQFLIKFALGTLVTIAFALQHGIQVVFRLTQVEKEKDRRVAYFFAMTLMLMLSIGIVIEIINYALNK
jgi:hypothetical protein